MRFNHKKELRAKAARICEDYKTIAMPMKMMKLLEERRELAYGIAAAMEPLKKREIAIGMTVLHSVEKDLSALLDAAERTADEKTLVEIVNLIESKAKGIESKTPLEIVRSGVKASLFEELKLYGFGGRNLGVLRSFAEWILPPEKELMLPCNPEKNEIYLQGQDAPVGWFDIRENRVYKAVLEPDAKYFPTISAAYNAQSKHYEITSLPMKISIPGEMTRLGPIAHLSEAFGKMNIAWESFAQRISGILVNLGVVESEALAAINSPPNYSFVFQTPQNGEMASPAGKSCGFEVLAEFSVSFTTKGSWQSVGVSTSLNLQEKQLKLVPRNGNHSFTDNEAHLELVGRNPNVPLKNISPEQLN
ncbi:MAG: hypothetical protein WCT52_06050 [Candidatus Micrarchaeia archaeon]